jgi:sulfatase maturation enzyme AslB (radical SAM superfamily)
LSIERRCEFCWLWAQCHGPCPWEIAGADGSFPRPHRYCEVLKRGIERAAYAYVRKQERDSGKGRVQWNRMS